MLQTHRFLEALLLWSPPYFGFRRWGLGFEVSGLGQKAFVLG